MFIKMWWQEIVLRAGEYLLTGCEWSLRREEIHLKTTSVIPHWQFSWHKFNNVLCVAVSDCCQCLRTRLEADFLSWQKPLAASQQVLACSQNNFLSSHFNEDIPGWSFKQRQLNQAITIVLRLTEHANIYLNACPVIVFSHLPMQSLFSCTRSQQCFTTATIRSFSHFEHFKLPLSLYCDVAFTRCE